MPAEGEESLCSSLRSDDVLSSRAFDGAYPFPHRVECLSSIAVCRRLPFPSTKVVECEVVTAVVTTAPNAAAWPSSSPHASGLPGDGEVGRRRSPPRPDGETCQQPAHSHVSCRRNACMQTKSSRPRLTTGNWITFNFKNQKMSNFPLAYHRHHLFKLFIYCLPSR